MYYHFPYSHQNSFLSFIMFLSFSNFLMFLDFLKILTPPKIQIHLMKIENKLYRT
ncbi:hypothetical protein HanHA89_Chr10g0378361 [Helianthus annuus]|nr:hypothetical protein HanHA89_Chr10g0378361 [Helianthus annuus]